MPYNFITNEQYSVDFSKLFDEINKVDLLMSSTIQKDYISKWMEVLKHHDNALMDETATREQREKIRRISNQEIETFQKSTYWSTDVVLIHFRVTMIRQLILESFTESNDPAEVIDIDEFTSPTRMIDWTPTDSEVSSFSKPNEPIIIVPFYSKNHNQLVIDGNHRLTNRVNNAQIDISAYSFAEQSVVDCKMCKSSFDLCYYLMNNELHRTAIAIHREKMSIEHALENSYLNKGLI